MEKQEKHKLINAVIYPLLLVGIMGIVHFIQYVFDLDFFMYGIHPRDWSGLVGVLLTPFLHGDFWHLFHNALPLIILGSSLFFFYKKIALKVLIWICLMGGSWTWIFARDSYHIGASGVVYGLFSFLIVSGFMRKNLQLVMLSFFVVFVYGSLVWGIFPIKVETSYEGHFWGFVSGIILAVYYKKQGPQKIEYVWEEEDEDEEEYPYWETDTQQPEQSQQINYIYKPKELNLKNKK